MNVLSPFLCLWHGFARNPRLALGHVRDLRLRARTWRRLSLRIHGSDFLADFYAASREAGIRPFLMWGTLLGCMREGRLLDHDQDLDIGILHGDYARKDRLIAAMKAAGYRVRFDTPYKFSLLHRDGVLHLDVDVFYPWNGALICTTVRKGAIIGTSFPADSFGRLKEIVFMDDLGVLVPDPPEPILTAVYGNWRTPQPGYNSGRDPLNRLQIKPGDPLPVFPSAE